MQPSGDCRHHPHPGGRDAAPALTKDADGRRPSGCAPRGDEACVIHVSDPHAPGTFFSGCRLQPNSRVKGCLFNLEKTPWLTPRLSPGSRAQCRQSASETPGWIQAAPRAWALLGPGARGKISKVHPRRIGPLALAIPHPTCCGRSIGRGRAPSRPAPQPIAGGPRAPPRLGHGPRCSGLGGEGALRGTCRPGPVPESIQSEYDSCPCGWESLQGSVPAGKRNRLASCGRAPRSGAGSPPRS